MVPSTAHLPPAAPDPHCPLCGGIGYLLDAGGELARATLCSCVPSCGRCRDSGRVILETPEGFAAGRCKCQRIPDRIGLFNRAGLPARYALVSLAGFMHGALQYGDHEKIRAMGSVTAWMDRFDPKTENPGLVLYGEVGRGKTHLLAAMVKSLVFEKGVPARFIEFSRLLGMLKEGFSAGRSGSELMDELVSAPVLAIDELGKGRMTDWELTVIDEIVSRRYNAMRCTLATTNYAPKGASGAEIPNAATPSQAAQTLGDRVGDRVWSRLREMGSFVEVRGQDFRTLAERHSAR